MRYLLTGANGMLGRDIQDVFAADNVTALGHAELDVTHLDAVREAVSGHDVVINSAAVTNVDAAQEQQDLAHAVNARGAENVAVACAEHGARLLHISTDYVFDGKATEPYAEGAPLSPLSVYGLTKAEGEKLAQEAHPDGTLIVRTAWLYGQHGPNFANTILRLARSNDPLQVTDDQRGQPTWTMDVAKQLAALIQHDAPAGIYHATNSGSATRFEFAQALLENAKLDPARVKKTTSDQLHRSAPRPAFSVLGHDAWARAGIPEMRPWREALHDAFVHGAVSA